MTGVFIPTHDQGGEKGGGGAWRGEGWGGGQPPCWLATRLPMQWMCIDMQLHQNKWGLTPTHSRGGRGQSGERRDMGHWGYSSSLPISFWYDIWGHGQYQLYGHDCLYAAVNGRWNSPCRQMEQPLQADGTAPAGR